MQEIWKDIPNYEGLYQVSNLGRVKSLFKYKKILKPRPRNGYLRVSLTKNNKSTNYAVHRLVAQAFISNPNNLPEINHKDENKQNNCVDNLEFCTRKYNMKYGTWKDRRLVKFIKPVVQYDLNGNFIRNWTSIKDAKTKLNINNIPAVCKGKAKQSGGYIWKYINEGGKNYE